MYFVIVPGISWGAVDDGQDDVNGGECEEQLHFDPGQCPGNMDNEWPIQM